MYIDKDDLITHFFRVFGIEPKIYKTDGRDIDDNGDVCSWYIEEVYPEISDRKLLEMICILSAYNYIFEDLKEVLREHIKTLKPDNPLLFPNRAGNYINASNFRERFWKKLLELCKITKRVRLHDLRGSYTDMTLSSGLSIKFTQNQLGHSKAETTTNIYMRNNQDMIDHAMNKLNGIFEKNQQKISIISNDPNKKIIPFRKKQSGTYF